MPTRVTYRTGNYNDYDHSNYVEGCLYYLLEYEDPENEASRVVNKHIFLNGQEYTTTAEYSDVFMVDSDGNLRINTDVLMTTRTSASVPGYAINKHVSVASPEDIEHAANKGYVDDLILLVPKYTTLVVDELPEDPDTETIYLVRTGSTPGNQYTEYIYVADSNLYLNLDNFGVGLTTAHISTRGGMLSGFDFVGIHSDDITVSGYNSYLPIRDDTAPTFVANTYYRRTSSSYTQYRDYPPEDWYSSYYKYYSSNSNNSIPVQGVAPTFTANTFYKYEGGDYLLLESSPPGWSTNYKNYFRKTSNNTYVAVSPVAPTFIAAYTQCYKLNYATYEVLTTEPADWATTYKQYSYDASDNVQFWTWGSALVSQGGDSVYRSLNHCDYIILSINTPEPRYDAFSKIAIQFSGSGWEQLGEQPDLSGKMDKFGNYVEDVVNNAGIITPIKNKLVITNLQTTTTPTNNDDIANKAYVDSKLVWNSLA